MRRTVGHVLLEATVTIHVESRWEVREGYSPSLGKELRTQEERVVGSSRQRVSAFAQSAQCERFSQCLHLSACIAAAQSKSFSLQQFYLAIECREVWLKEGITVA